MPFASHRPRVGGSQVWQLRPVVRLSLQIELGLFEVRLPRFRHLADLLHRLFSLCRGGSSSESVLPTVSVAVRAILRFGSYCRSWEN